MNSGCSTIQLCKASSPARSFRLPSLWMCLFDRQSGQTLPLDKSALWDKGRQFVRQLPNTYFARVQEMY